GCEQELAYYQSTTAIKIHLLSLHHITKAVVQKNQNFSQQLLPKILKDISIASLSKKKQKELNQYLIRFIVGTIQPLQLVEALDFIEFCNQLDFRYKIPSKKFLKDEIDFVYHYSSDQIKELINN
ncbi:10602_t:CDS:1, partial [Scutellospora calospora]